jgi:glycosyltransferase involved in cell wall biosynthesis
MLTIITAVKNGAKTIERTILSVLNQNYQDFEYIVVDGVSTDGTLEILKKYSYRIKVISEPDTGIYDAMNKGIVASSGEWVYFLGCDDILYSDLTLSKVFSYDLSETDVIYGNVEFLNSHQIYDGEYDYTKLSLRSPCHQAVFYKKILFNKYGCFDTVFSTAADYVLHVKTFCGGARWTYINEIIAVYNEKGISFTKRDKKYYSELYRILFDNFSSRISEITLSRLFFSHYPEFFFSHSIKESFLYLKLTISKIGLFELVKNFFLLLYNLKIRNAEG